jgi:hypothetical protein
MLTIVLGGGTFPYTRCDPAEYARQSECRPSQSKCGDVDDSFGKSLRRLCPAAQSG